MKNRSEKVREYQKKYQKKYRSKNKEYFRQYRQKNRSKILKQIKTSLEKSRFNGNKKFILWRDNHVCVVCCLAENLCIHHMDGISYHNTNNPNNKQENLVLVCRSCHGKIHRQKSGEIKSAVESYIGEIYSYRQNYQRSTPDS